MTLKPPKKFKCSECERSFENNGHLEYHMNSVHWNKRPYKCKNCKLAFYREKDLTRHVNAVHLNIKKT